MLAEIKCSLLGTLKLEVEEGSCSCHYDGAGVEQRLRMTQSSNQGHLDPTMTAQRVRALEHYFARDKLSLGFT